MAHRVVRGNRVWRGCQLLGLLLLVGAALLLVVPGRAGASNPATTGSVTITCLPTACAPGTPYPDQQSVDISVPANSTFTPNQTVQIIECADPGGLVANVPTTAAGNCDGLTINQDGLQINADGSFDESAYALYSLPSTTLLEKSSGVPKCDLVDPCVLYIGQDYNHLAASIHVFSAPFTVTPPATVSASAARSTVVAAPGTVAADGLTPATVTVTLLDQALAPVAGKAVNLGQGTGHSFVATLSGTTNASGVARFSVTDSTVETVAYTATDTIDSVVVTQVAHVAFSQVTTTTTTATSTTTTTTSPRSTTTTTPGTTSTTVSGDTTTTLADPSTTEAAATSPGSGGNSSPGSSLAFTGPPPLLPWLVLFGLLLVIAGSIGRRLMGVGAR